MSLSVPTVEEIKKILLSTDDELKGIEAIGLCGSMVRGNFSAKSDIDIFIVVADGISERDTWISWNKRLRNSLKIFQRDLTILVYSIKSLKEISSWYVLRLASEGRLIYDPQDRIKELFGKILKTGENAGLIEEEINGYKYWIKKDLKIGDTLILKVDE